MVATGGHLNRIRSGVHRVGKVVTQKPSYPMFLWEHRFPKVGQRSLLLIKHWQTWHLASY